MLALEGNVDVKALFIVSDIVASETWVYTTKYVIYRHILQSIFMVFDHLWMKKNTYKCCVVRNQGCVLYRHPLGNWSWNIFLW